MRIAGLSRAERVEPPRADPRKIRAGCHVRLKRSPVMKLRSVLLVLLILCGFYLLSTHFFPIGTIANLVHGSPEQSGGGVTTSTLNGPLGTFKVTEAEAAPALDSEEERNVAVYK